MPARRPAGSAVSRRRGDGPGARGGATGPVHRGARLPASCSPPFADAGPSGAWSGAMMTGPGAGRSRKCPVARGKLAKMRHWRSIRARGSVELDDFDRRLLDALQTDSRRTGEELAAVVGLSAAACLRRAQRLREAGVI